MAPSASTCSKIISWFSVRQLLRTLTRRNRRISSTAASPSRRTLLLISWRLCYNSSPTREIKASTLNRIGRSRDHNTARALPTSSSRMRLRSSSTVRHSTSPLTRRKRRSC
jgi:hypothetical protein